MGAKIAPLRSLEDRLFNSGNTRREWAVMYCKPKSDVAKAFVYLFTRQLGLGVLITMFSTDAPIPAFFLFFYF